MRCGVCVVRGAARQRRAACAMHHERAREGWCCCRARRATRTPAPQPPARCRCRCVCVPVHPLSRLWVCLRVGARWPAHAFTSLSPRSAQVVIPETPGLKKLKVSDLRALCTEHKVTSTGTKDVLVQRLDALRKGRAGSPDKRPAAARPAAAARSGAVTPESTPKQRGGKSPLSAGRRGRMLRGPRVCLCARVLSHVAKPDDFFSKYADESGTKIGLEGFTQLTLDLAGGDEELAMKPETTIMLLFMSWKMGSPRFGEISKEGFKKGLDAMKCYSLAQVLDNRGLFMSQLTKVTEEVKSAPNSYLGYERIKVDAFSDFYNFCFDLLKPEGKKYVEKDMGCAALSAIWKQIPGRTSPHIDSFVEFLNQNEKLLSINSDQWKSFVQFSKQVGHGEAAQRLVLLMNVLLTCASIRSTPR